ncbi:YafY family transcriptional regulator [Sphingobacterium sp. SRCM116780]|uniref:helix-turn-helix transcriptional regulator n=1 Tax=Sphingobacterium sp. SRCM116780 TaxID=2907623 RepID=UPI001F38BB2B|nr:YafY family protein [Sphingobacterium sp. SRCM116780]UIR57715.1 YafY family transcriptional regulator [Sphingobacterium sp. SRCM116780]
MEPLNRFDRILAILIQLQSKKTIKAQELAERFEVSLRTIYRDIKSLIAAGIPIIGEAGVGYELVEGYKIPPMMFSKAEITSFVAAEKLVYKFIDQELKNHFSAALYKLKSIVRSADKDWMETIDKHVVMKSNQHSQLSSALPNTLTVLFQSIAQKNILEISYQATYQQESIQREIEPIGVFHENNHWYIYAFCLVRNDYRQFRTDRISNIKILDQTQFKQHPDLEQYLAEREVEVERTRVIIQVDQQFAHYLHWERKYFGFQEETIKNGKVKMVFDVKNVHMGFARWFMMFGDHADIISPKALKEKVKELLQLQLLRLE